MGEVEKVLRDIADYHDNEGSHWKAIRCREAASLLTKLQARDEQLEADFYRWVNAYRIAHDQAMANGSRAQQLEAQLSEANQLIGAIEGENTIVRQLAEARSDEHPIVAEIMAEVEKATRKFPTWPTRIIDAGNVLTEEAGEAAKAILQVVYEPHKSTLADVREEVVQTAAMCFRFLASMDRYDVSPGEQHQQPVIRALAPGCEHQTGPIGDAG